MNPPHDASTTATHRPASVIITDEGYVSRAFDQVPAECST